MNLSLNNPHGITPRIIFMGTPEFAVESLRALVENNYNVVAVVTMPDKPAGRGHQLQQSDVKKYALSVGLPILQPEKLKDETFLTELRSYNADLQIVVAFRMLPEVVWAMPPLGTFNLHAALLPQYRGAAPLNWAVINGEKETGATTFFLKQEIDTGDMILQESLPIGEDENVGSVHDRLMTMGAQLVLKTVDLIAEGKAQRIPQPILPESEMKPAPKIFKETCEIHFDQPAVQVHNFVRGLSPYPAAWAKLNIGGTEQVVKIYKTKPIVTDNFAYEGFPPEGNGKGATILTDNKTYFRIATTDGYIDILELQLPGKKRMDIRSLLNGIKL